MSEDHKKVLKQQLWNIVDTLRGKMNAVDVVLWRYCVMNLNYLAMIQRFKTYP